MVITVCREYTVVRLSTQRPNFWLTSTGVSVTVRSTRLGCSNNVRNRIIYQPLGSVSMFEEQVLHRLFSCIIIVRAHLTASPRPQQLQI
jgi:hypothetical protein